MNLQNTIFKFLLTHEKSKFLHFLFNGFSNNGFIPAEVKEEDYVLGVTKTREVLQPDGQWIDYKPMDESQRGKLTDPMACVSFSLNNAVEILGKRKWGNDWNKSDRYLAKLSGTSTRGNTQRRVGDAFRTYGAVSETVWPYNQDTFSWAKYYEAIPNQAIEWGTEFIKEYNLEYEAVPVYNKKSLMDALKYSPLWVAGYAWMRSGDKYVSYGSPNHCFLIIGYKENEYWIAYDSYSPYVKFLDWNFNISYPKTVYLEHRDEEKEKKARALVEIKKLKEKGFKYVMRSDVRNGGRGQVYELTNDGLTELNNQDKMETGIRELFNKKDLTGITEEYFNKLT